MKIKIKKVPRQPNIEAYGGFLDAADNLFAIGGDMQTNGSDFTNGAIHVDEGGSHEENPNQGVQMGVDNEGTPNLVEEGEVIFNDYVYSNRIELDSEAKEKMHFPKKRDITYADAAKSLEKESKERPNDPISKAALKVQMEDLANEQERQKQEMEAEKAREAFEALSPEEQVAVMQQASEQEQMAQEQAMQEQAMAEQAAAQQQAMGQPSPEEMAMMQQQQMMAQPEAAQPEMMQGQPMMAYGGNLFAWGGDKMNQALRFLKEKGITGNTAKDIATAMSRMPYANNPNTSINYLYGKLLKGFNASEKGYEENYRQMRELGMSHNSAMAVLKQQRPTKWNSSRDSSMRQWDKLGNTWQQSYNQTAAQQQPTRRKASSYTPNSVDWYRQQGQKFKEAQAAITRDSQATQAPTVKSATQNITQPAAARTTRRAAAPVVNQRAAVSPVASVPQGNDSGFIAPAEYINDGTWNIGNYEWLTNPEYQDSLTEGHIPFSRSADEKEIEAAEGSKSFRNWTDYVTNNFYNTENKEVQDYLHELDKRAGGNHLFDTSGKPVEGALDYFLHARGLDTERYGAGDHAWGFYHLTPTQIAAQQDANGKIFHLMEGEDGDYISEGDAANYPETRRVPDDQGNIHVYHKAPQNATLTEEQLEKAVPGSTVQNKPKEEYDVVPVHKAAWPRYAGLLGPAVGLGMMAAGIGRPDNKRWSNIVEAAQGPASLADYQVIGNYLRYKPLDIWAEQNRLNANTRATDRALTNNSSPIGTRMAGLLANEYANQLGSANLFRQAQEYNDNLRRVVGEYNKDTDKFNAEAYNRAALTNAEIRNRQKQFAANIALQAEHAKANADADWYNGIYGNISGLFKGIGDIGRENAQHNMIADMAADGIFGTISDRQNIGNGFLKKVPKKNTTAKGGKISKRKGKRGLTF